MKLLQKAENQMAFGKVGILGFQGSGKSYTAALIAVGICEMTGNRKVAWFDTETGSDFLVDLFKNNGIELFVFKGRAFSDLLDFLKECEAEGICVAIVDSVTHVWRNLIDSYVKKQRINRMEFQHWAKVKGPGAWQDFTDLFVNCRVHVIICGRAGYEYDYDINEDGSKDLVKTGTKMKAEGEFGFEPSLVIEMERLTQGKKELEDIKNDRTSVAEKRKKKQGVTVKIGSAWIHRAYILKDRTDSINGLFFDYPTFNDFMPHFKKLNLGGQHFGFDTTKDSTDRFDDDGRTEFYRKRERRAVALDTIQSYLTQIWPGTTKDEKAAKGWVIQKLFNNPSWKNAETNIDLFILEGAAKITEHLAIRFPEMLQDKDFASKPIEKQIEQAILICRQELESKKSAVEQEDDIPL